MEHAVDSLYSNFEESYRSFIEASELTKKDKTIKLLSQIDIMVMSRNGLTYLYEISDELERAGIFKDSPWEYPDKLVPSLVKGTLKSGHPNSTLEILSELRLLKYCNSKNNNKSITSSHALAYLEEVLVHNLEFALKDPSEETRSTISERDLKKAYNLFGYLISEIDLNGVYEKLAEEIHLICEQRPIVTRKARKLINLIDGKFNTSGESETDKLIRTYINAVHKPSKGVRENPDLNTYKQFLENASFNELAVEASDMGSYMRSTGLVSKYHALLLKYLDQTNQDLIPDALDLQERGIAELKKFNELISNIIEEIISPHNSQCIYGLSNMLNKNLFSRRPVRVGLENMRRIKINSQVDERIRKSRLQPDDGVSSLQYLLGGVIKVLGQPLGVGQGNNPTCQSARGISMWSQHAPAKLIDMIITVATQNNLIIRFENRELESAKLGKGLVENLDYNLDVISVVLVPHLDKIYNEMMKIATGRGEDPHKWVNPAMYGHWIQVGFASCYDYLSNSVLDFEGFIRIFYASFHPDYNGDRHMVYPNPVGIFITSNKGEMIGFHAVSLLRVDKDKLGETRAYFLNPNNEGRQDWGQNILPSVHGYGEKHGESSLPIKEFAARLYAFHYDQLDINPWFNTVDQKQINEVKELAMDSWGKSYIWNHQKKLW